MTLPFTLIDLSHTLDENIPTWDGGCGFKHHLHIDYADCEGDTKFRIMKVTMNAGIGTHMDAPSHCISGGRCVHEIEINEFFMPCCVIDISDRASQGYSLTLQDVMDFENQFSPVFSGAGVFVKTGWSRYWGDPVKYRNDHKFPSVALEAAEYLLAKGVRALGIDTLSADRPEDDFKVHKAFLGSNKFLIENVANLDQMQAVGGFVLALPMKIKDGTEAPVRLVGLVESKGNPN